MQVQVQGDTGWGSGRTGETTPLREVERERGWKGLTGGGGINSIRRIFTIRKMFFAWIPPGALS